MKTYDESRERMFSILLRPLFFGLCFWLPPATGGNTYADLRVLSLARNTRPK